MTGVRLFGRLHPGLPKKATSIRLRVITRAVPVGAHVDVTDLQLQPGRLITGWAPHDADMGVRPVEGYQWRSGVIYGNNTVIVVADELTASPTRWEITRAGGAMQIGDYHLGPTTTAVVDGLTGTATQGAGIPPHLTARADIDVPVLLEGRAFVSCWFRGLAQVAPEPPLPDPDPIDPAAVWPDPGEIEIEQPPEPPPPDPDVDEEEQ